jgi:hypothetical protein
MGLLRGLRAHHAELVATLGNQQCVGGRSNAEQAFHPASAWVDQHDVAVKVGDAEAFDRDKSVASGEDAAILVALDKDRIVAGRAGTRGAESRDVRAFGVCKRGAHQGNHDRCCPNAAGSPGRRSHRASEYLTASSSEYTRENARSNRCRWRRQNAVSRRGMSILPYRARSSTRSRPQNGW